VLEAEAVPLGVAVSEPEALIEAEAVCRGRGAGQAEGR
jgi:hypothetical protein